MRHVLLARKSMCLAVDVIHGHGQSNGIHTQLQPKRAALAVSRAAIGIIRTVHC